MKIRNHSKSSKSRHPPRNLMKSFHSKSSQQSTHFFRLVSWKGIFPFVKYKNDDNEHYKYRAVICFPSVLFTSLNWTLCNVFPSYYFDCLVRFGYFPGAAVLSMRRWNAWWMWHTNFCYVWAQKCRFSSIRNLNFLFNFKKEIEPKEVYQCFSYESEIGETFLIIFCRHLLIWLFL